MTVGLTRLGQARVLEERPTACREGGEGGFTFFRIFVWGSLASSLRYLLTLRVCGLRAGLSSSPGRAEPVIIQYSSRELN